MMMNRCFAILATFLVLGIAETGSAQPLEFSDDFLTATTLDSFDYLMPTCINPPPNYTIMESAGDVFSERAIIGPRRSTLKHFPGTPGGRREGELRISNNSTAGGGTFEGERFEFAIIGRVGLGTGCPGEPVAINASSMAFTSPDVCVYGGYEYAPWHLKTPAVSTGCGGILGPDLLPGVAGVDDDGDGTTDGTVGLVGVDDDLDGTIDEANEVLECDESPALAPSTAVDGYDPYPGGVDGKPGIAGTDDDANGVTDDVGETGSAGSDDGDDVLGRLFSSIMFKLDLGAGDSVILNLDPGSGGGNIFSFREFLAGEDSSMESSNEVTGGFYNPYTYYNYAMCVSGTCYGAMLWIGNDLTNPSETLGPLLNTNHTGVGANLVAMAANAGNEFFIREVVFKGNRSFSDKLWAVSGSASTYFPSPTTDLDGDRDVDGNDFLTFSNCFNGSLKPPKAICVGAQLLADFDADSDVDGNDFLTFSNCFNGSLNPPKPLCRVPNLTACP